VIDLIDLLCLMPLSYSITRLTATSNKVYQLLAHGRWFSLGTPASSTTKTGRHDIAEILLKMALKHQRSILFLLLIEHLVETSFIIISTCYFPQV
jgi:hypothetical protein